MLRELRSKSAIREDQINGDDHQSTVDAIVTVSNGHGHDASEQIKSSKLKSNIRISASSHDTSVASYSRSIIPRSSRVLTAYNSAVRSVSSSTSTGVDSEADSVIDALAKKYSHIRRVTHQQPSPPSALRAPIDMRKETIAKTRSNVTFSVATSIAVANAAVADAPKTGDSETNDTTTTNTTVSNGSNSNDTITSNDGTQAKETSAVVDTIGTMMDSMDNESNAPGHYVNWTSQHANLASSAWCCIGDLIAFCDRYEFKALGLNDNQAHQAIVKTVKALLAGLGPAPFDLRRRFPAYIRSPENLWMCIDRCPSVEYHLKRILSVFRRPLPTLTVDKQRSAIQTFHLAVNELRLDISARITEVKLYDRLLFERDFHLQWEETKEPAKEAKRS